MSLFRRRYGSNPLHLLLHLVWILVAGWALLRLLAVEPLLYVVGWLVGAVVLHDFVLLPFYGVLDRVGRIPLRGAVNYVRVPVVLSGLLLLAYFPIITGGGQEVFSRVSGAGYSESYFGRWLLVSAGLFLASAVLYGVRAAASQRSGARSPGSTS